MYWKRVAPVFPIAAVIAASAAMFVLRVASALGV